MSLRRELNLRNPIKSLPHEVLLNVYFTAQCIKKDAGRFFHSFGLTDVQFNLMMLLKHQSDPRQGLSQAQISEMMLVNRANTTTLIDRMEKAGLVQRTASVSDRRTNIIKLSSRGKKLLEEVEPRYADEVQRIMASFNTTEQKKIIALLEKIRQFVNGHKQN